MRVWSQTVVVGALLGVASLGLIATVVDRLSERVAYEEEMVLIDELSAACATLDAECFD